MGFVHVGWVNDVGRTGGDESGIVVKKSRISLVCNRLFKFLLIKIKYNK